MSQTQEILDKILEKSFADMKKRLSSLIIKQEKKIVKDLKMADKPVRKPRGEKERESTLRREGTHRRDNVSRREGTLRRDNVSRRETKHKRSASSSTNSSE
jgi:uncharacterized protein with ParB-like and HNH nuclease domain